MHLRIPRLGRVQSRLSISSETRCFSSASTESSHGARNSLGRKKYNLKNHKSPNSRSSNDPRFAWSYIKPSSSSSPISEHAWQLNAEQNTINQIRVNPLNINMKETPSAKQEAELAKWNSEYGGPDWKRMTPVATVLIKVTEDSKDRKLELQYSFPLKEGQLYTLYDLTLKASQQRGAVRSALEEPITDPFERINVDPFWEYKNWDLLSNFVSSLGKILPGNKTGCSAKNQRRLSKAIRRARALGFMPLWSRHPLVPQTPGFQIIRQRFDIRTYKHEEAQFSIV